MKDLTYNRKDKSGFITGYSISDKNITISFADGNTSVLPFSKNLVIELEDIMKKQALNSEYTDKINDKIRINNFVMYGSSLVGIISGLAVGAFALTKNNNLIGPSFITMASCAIADHISNRHLKKLYDLQESAERYKFIAENIDSFNDEYADGSGLRKMSMNDCDNIDFHSIKKLVKFINKD